MKKLSIHSALLALGVGFTCSFASADEISPETFSATLTAGESTTLTKTVTISAGTASSALIDVMFLIDTSGSMGGEIAAAKAAATGLLTELSGFGDLASGTGYFSEPGSDGVISDLSTTDATTVASINTFFTGAFGGGDGGDFPEEGLNAVREAALGASWRPGSSRFIIALGDATFKPSDGTTLASTLTALDDLGGTFIGIDFGAMTRDDLGGIDPTVLADATGGSIVSSTDDPAAIIAAITSGITDAFSEYDSVSVSDFGIGLPGVSLSVACLTADTGACAGSEAIGSFDRSIDRTFTFEATFTALEDGVHVFDTHALVDGGIVATEIDTITVGGTSAVPEPGSLALLGGGLFGLFAARRRRDSRGS